MKKNRMKVRIKASDHRNEPHFDHLRNYHPTTITESRKFRKPKHKKNWMDEADEWKLLTNQNFAAVLFLASALLPEGEGVGEARGRGRQYEPGSL